MRKISGLLLCILVLVLGSLVLVGEDPAPKRVDTKAVQSLLERRLTQEFVPGEVIVKMKAVAGITRVMPSEALAQANLERRPRQTSGGEFIYRMPSAAMQALSAKDAQSRTMAAVEAMRARPEVEYAQPNYIYQIATTSPNDPLFNLQWHYFVNGGGTSSAPGGINLPIAWDTTKGSPSVVVAVLDTGILPNHQDISGSPNLVAGHDMISDSSNANDGDGRDSDPTDPGDAVAANECFPGSRAQPSSWHGTHVAGTVGVGKTNNNVGVAGVNWDVGVQAVRVLGKCGGTSADISDAIRWAAGLSVPGVPDNATPAKVINMSLGGGGSCGSRPVYQNAINDAVGAGVTVVVAAGNGAQNAANVTPASCDNVITVAASDFRGRLVTRYSNFGSKVDIMAPGGDLERDDNGDGNRDGVLSMVDPSSPLSSFSGGYAFYNGTSMAAPQTTGVAALLLAQDSSLSPSQILARIKANAIPRSATECPRPCGAGLLDSDFGHYLLLSPAHIELRWPGKKKAELTVILKDGGVPQAGKTVTFQSNDDSVASVSSTSEVTNADGEAKVTVKRESGGETTIRAEADGKSNEARVKVPSISTWGLLLLALVTLLLFYRWSHKSPST